jgi:hypothetical protein
VPLVHGLAALGAVSGVDEAGGHGLGRLLDADLDLARHNNSR